MRPKSKLYSQLVLLPSLALVACGSNASVAEKELLAQTWATTEEACGRDFLRFTPTAFEVHYANMPTTAVQVLKITKAKDYPDHVMVVIGPNEPGSTKPVPEAERVGFVLEVANNRLKLVGAGPPLRLTRVTAANPNVERFNRVACPA